MKRTLAIIAAVAVYCLFEVVLLLSIDISDFNYPTSGTRQMTTGAAQLLLIPCLAALFSRIMYGAWRWKRRFLLILAYGAGCVPAVVILVVVIATPLGWAFSNGMLLFVPLLVLVSGSVFAGLFFLVRKMRRRGVQLESARWLAERQSGASSADRRRRNRTICYSLWIPSFIVLFVFLFLPEICGIFSHRFQFQARPLLGYRVRVPATWIIEFQQTLSETGESHISGWAGRGLGFNIRRYLRWWDLSLSGWTVGTESYNPGSRHWTPNMADVYAQRDFVIGNEHLTCLEYRPQYQLDYMGGSSIVYVNCSGPGRLYASFVGKRLVVPKFYGMLENIKRQAQ